VNSILRAFRYRNFRLFFAGQTASLIGTLIQQIALSWLVYRLTASSLLLGLVTFAGQIPLLVITPFGGVFSDRFNRRRILIVMQTLAMMQAFLLAYLNYSGQIQIWQIILLSLILGIINAIETPTRQSFVLEMVGNKQDLPNAIALHSITMNSAKIIGPSIAGVLLLWFSEELCFLINAISYLCVLIALLMMRLEKHQTNKKHKHVFHALLEAARYAIDFAPVRMLLALVILLSLTVSPYAVLLPVYAKEIFGGGPEIYGSLVSAAACGALLGALYLASRKNVHGLDRTILISATTSGAALLLFSFSHYYWLSLFLLLLTGGGLVVTAASVNMILQTIVDDDKRGRIMSFYSMAFLGMAPIGSLLAGALADHIGPAHTLFMGGVGCLFAALLFAYRRVAMRKLIHPIYIKLGIIAASE
jgi:MFS family permease